MTTNNIYMQRAIDLALNGMNSNCGGPFGSVIVNEDGKIIGEGCNQVTSTNDPTAHAEMVAIRNACKNIKSFQLDKCIIYTSCEPCPMCLGAIYWSRCKKIYFGCNREDAANICFDDNFIYEEVKRDLNDRQLPIVGLMRDESLVVFNEWEKKQNRIEY